MQEQQKAPGNLGVLNQVNKKNVMANGESIFFCLQELFTTAQQVFRQQELDNQMQVIWNGAVGM